MAKSWLSYGEVMTKSIFLTFKIMAHYYTVRLYNPLAGSTVVLTKSWGGLGHIMAKLRPGHVELRQLFKNLDVMVSNWTT